MRSKMNEDLLAWAFGFYNFQVLNAFKAQTTSATMRKTKLCEGRYTFAVAAN